MMEASFMVVLIDGDVRCFFERVQHPKLAVAALINTRCSTILP
jgi:hypothetical protein